MSGGQEILDFPLEVTGDRDVTDVVVTMAAAVSELTGTLTDNTASPRPTTRSSWRRLTAATGCRFATHCDDASWTGRPVRVSRIAARGSTSWRRSSIQNRAFSTILTS
jgi:hypothetical protein